ncbi:MAG: OmpA family protein [Lutibacter sp.]|uniref:OmpA family protein n=1 Tax=Lutibacter sp. TaxID=1925666 RepID=UPI00184F0998|nr:OmpA family protein [Lutibacter sp.]MBT8316451.1 OmpA family protein [Lutibacter sp.]NNJ57311.1 OmpA family protein [Lutibacter sp.]
MKTIKLITIVFLLICSSSFGQSGKLKRADRHYNSFSFVKAIEKYEKLIDTNFNKSYAMRKLGDSYMYLRKPKEAVEIYKHVVQQENVPEEYYYFYAQALRGVGNYDESNKWMVKYEQFASEDSRVAEFLENEDFISAMFNLKKQYSLANTNLNTPFSDFGAVEYNDEVVFVSSKDEGISIKRKYAWNAQPFLDIYSVGKDGSVEKANKINGEVNSIYHDGPVCFTEDGTKMYFTRNNFNEGDKGADNKGINNLKIYSADLVNGEWTNIQGVHFNNDEYSVGHPSVSEDGTKMYFTSDMPGGIGGSDIYVVDINDDGTLGTPENMGNVVNTEGNEMFPFIHNEGTLFFSSDGHVGFGLLDVFATISDENNSIVNILNLGEPINSSKDDFSYYLSKEGFDGYISSNREGGVGDDDIYKFTRIPPLTLKGQIFDDANNEPIVNAKVVLKDANGDEIAYFITEANGYYEHIVDRDANFTLEGTKEKYTSLTREFNSFNLDREKELVVNLNVGIKPIEDVVLLADLEIIYFDLDKSNIRPDAALELDKVVALMNKYPGMVIRLESHTDSRANDDYNIRLSNRRAKSTYEYIISHGINADRITKYEGFGETQLVNKCSNGVKCSKAEHQLNRRTEFIIIKMK